MWNLCKRANTSSTLDDVINMLWLINFEIVIAKKIRKKNMAKIKMCERFTDHYKILQSLFDCWVFSGLQFIARILRVSLFLFFFVCFTLHKHIANHSSTAEISTSLSLDGKVGSRVNPTNT